MLQGSSVLPNQSWHNRPVTAPVLVGNLEYSNQGVKKKKTRKMKYYEKNVSGKLTAKVSVTIGKNISKYCVMGKMAKMIKQTQGKINVPSC